jgi:hypothetical protein
VKNPNTAFASDQKRGGAFTRLPFECHSMNLAVCVWCISMMKRMTTTQNNELIPRPLGVVSSSVIRDLIG